MKVRRNYGECHRIDWKAILQRWEAAKVLPNIAKYKPELVIVL